MSIFRSYKNTIKHDFRKILRSDVSVPSRSWQSVYGCKVVYASIRKKLSVMNFNGLHSSMRTVPSANVVLHSLPCFNPMSLVRPILEYGAACWDPYREGQISGAIDRVQKKAVIFAYHTNSANWETLTSRRKLSRLCALFKAFSGERAWKEIGDRLKRPHYLSRVDHDRKIRSRRQRTDIGKYSFVNRTIQHWNQLPAEVLETLPRKPATFKRRVRKVLTEVS